MDSYLNAKRYRDTETALETIIPIFNQKSRNTNSIKTTGSAISQMFESENFESATNKK